jgi:endoglucanase
MTGKALKFLACSMLGLFAIGALRAQTPDAFTQAKRLGHGVNIIGYDPIWDSFEKGRFREKHFALLKEGGFHSVRINLHAYKHMDATGKLDETWFKTLDWAVEKALVNDLAVIIDLHNFVEMAKDPVGLKPKFLAFWKQVAPHFRNAPSTVMFEILNEPNGDLTPELWNQYLKEALAIIRESNPTRTVIIGPGFWNSINQLDTLKLPENDRNLIVTVHYYLPMEFTHQGAPWAKEWVAVSGVKWGTEAEKAKVVADFTPVQQWSKARQRPILLGEFGAYDKGDMASRAAYTAHVARTAESFGWAWSYWQFDSDFILYDIDKDKWTEPIRKALAP